VTSALTLADIVDLRAYEHERADFRARVIALKQRRRVPVGPVVTFVFENRDTLRFQIQEMARAERMLRDDQIQTELDTYNALLPGAGELSATMFIELTNDAELREWLPKLVGIEAAPRLILGEEVVPATVDPAHAEQLTRDTMTASVHYVRFKLSEKARSALHQRGIPLALAIEHPEYQYRTELQEDTRNELIDDAE
jgi:hypothetical protein